MTHQFQSFLAQNNYSLDKSAFQDFFEKSYKCFQCISIDPAKDLVSLKILLRMIGLLVPIGKETFDLDCLSAYTLTIKMMSYVRQNFNNLLKQINESEWLLLQSGLATFSCFELLQRRLDNSNNELTFLNEISDDKKRQDIAKEILLQLFKIDKPILVNPSWIELFLLINPDDIDIKYLTLAGSFEMFIMCITKISTKLTNYSDFEEKIDISFDNCVFFDSLQGKFK